MGKLSALAGELRIQSICQMIGATIAIGITLYWLRPVLLPFVLALFLVCGIAPLLDLIQQRIGAPRILAVAIAFLGGVVLLAALCAVIVFSVASMQHDSDVYRQRFENIASKISTTLGVKSDIESTGPSSESSDDSAEEQVPDDLADFARGFMNEGIAKVITALTGFLGNATMVLIFMFFLLLGGSTESVPRSGVWIEIESQIRGYIVTKTVISLFTGTVFGLVLRVYGIPLAIVFGLLAFLLNFIPNIGPIISSLLPLPLIILSPDLSIASMVTVILLTGGIQFVSGNVVEPKIMGDSFELHPVAILLTLMLWGMIWGITGMILATPVTAAIKILLQRFDRTRPLAEMLAGRFDAFRNLAGEQA